MLMAPDAREPDLRSADGSPADLELHDLPCARRRRAVDRADDAVRSGRNLRARADGGAARCPLEKGEDATDGLASLNTRLSVVVPQLDAPQVAPGNDERDVHLAIVEAVAGTLQTACDGDQRVWLACVIQTRTNFLVL